jgi:hypothetical protein
MKRKMKMDQILRRYWPGIPKHEVEAAGERIWMRLQEDVKKYDTSLWSLSGAQRTNQLEFQVLSAASSLGEHADLHSVSEMVEGWTGRSMIVRVQLALEDLENRRLIQVHRFKPAGTSGEPEIRFSLTEDGDRAVRRAHAEGKQLACAQRDELPYRCY